MTNQIQTEETSQVENTQIVATDVRNEVVLFANMSPALRTAALALATAQMAQIKCLQQYHHALELEITSIGEFIKALEAHKLEPNKRQALRAKLRRIDSEKGRIQKAITALENGYVPIPYLDHEKIPMWRTPEIPYPVLKFIKERGLETLFDELGVVLPQDQTFREITYQEPWGKDDVRERRVLARDVGVNQVGTRSRDPMLIGSLRVKGRRQWFLLAIWDNQL